MTPVERHLSEIKWLLLIVALIAGLAVAVPAIGKSSRDEQHARACVEHYTPDCK